MFIDMPTVQRYLASFVRISKLCCQDAPFPHAVIVPAMEIRDFLEFGSTDYRSCVLMPEASLGIPPDQICIVVDFFELRRSDRAMVFAFRWPDHVNWLRKLLRVEWVCITNGPNGSALNGISVHLVNREMRRAVMQWIRRCEGGYSGWTSTGLFDFAFPLFKLAVYILLAVTAFALGQMLFG